MTPRTPPRIRQWCPQCAAATQTEQCPGCGDQVCAECDLINWPYHRDDPAICGNCLAGELYDDEE